MRYLALIAILTLLCGCVSQRYRGLPFRSSEEYVALHQELAERDRARILDGQIWMGMTKDQLYGSWGLPNDINETAGPWGVHEQLVYNRGSYHAQYVYLEDGVVTGWQRF